MRFPITIALLTVFLAPALWADDFGKTVRDLRHDHRSRRLAALKAFADGHRRAETRSQADKLDRALTRYWSQRVSGHERALAVRALAQLKRPRAIERFAEWVPKERDDRVLLEAERAFATLHETSIPVLLKILRKQDDALGRAALLRCIGRVPGRGAGDELLRRASATEEWFLRATAALALARRPNRASFPPLIAMVQRDDPGMNVAAAEALTRLTRRDYGTDPVKWKVWWDMGGKVDPKKPKIDPLENDDGSGADGTGRRRYAHESEGDPLNPYYFGIRVRGRRIVFCYDISASMRYKLPLANSQIMRAIKGLPSAAQFEVIFFNEEVKPWRGRLSWADPITKELFLESLKDLEIKSYTNLFDSIELGLRMGADEIFVISDGEPNRGRKKLPRDILKELRRINKRAVKIHTVSVVRHVDGDEHLSLLKEIADQNGGQYTERTLK